MRWNAASILNDPYITLTGRRDEVNDPLRLFWVGSGLSLTARLRSLSATIEADWSAHAPWMAVTLDGAPVARFPLQRGLRRYALLTDMDPAVAHRIRVVRDTQPMEGDERMLVRLRAVEMKGEALPTPRLKTIEWIGDSLTSGEGLCGPVTAAEWKTVWMSGAMTCAAQACVLLDAEGEWISQSGWGIVTDWTQDRRHTLPRIYGDICGVLAAGSAPYDFAAHPADAVVINLGTNDANALSQLPPAERPARETEIADGVSAFLRQIRAARPNAPILWVCGMCGDSLNDLLRRAVAEASADMADPLIAFEPLPACAQDELGSLGHPGWRSHQRCAAIVARRLKELIENAGAM